MKSERTKFFKRVFIDSQSMVLWLQMFVICFLMIGLESKTHGQKAQKKAEPTSSASSQKNIRLSSLAKGETFQHPDVGGQCLSEANCNDVAAQYCANNKATRKECTEEYDDAWITVCECQ